MTKVIALLLIALCLLLVAGCVALPKPFHRSSFLPNALTEPKGDNGIRVSFPLGTTKSMSEQIANAVVQALLEQNIPATLGKTGKLRYLLSGRIESSAGITDSFPSRINWQLSENNDAWHYDFYQNFNEPFLVSETGPQTEIDNLGKATANIIVNTLAPEDKTLTPIISKPDGLWLLPITGRSKTRVRALNRAIKYALTNAKMKLSKTSATAQYFLKGKIILNSTKYKSHLVKIIWKVIRRDGSQIGELVQQNAIPAKNLDQSWNEVSLVIASAATPSIKDIINRASKALNIKTSDPSNLQETNFQNRVKPPLLTPSKFPIK